MNALFLLAGAAWRFWDGLGKKDARAVTGVRAVVGVAVALAAAWWSQGLDLVVLWLGGWAALNLIVGHTSWMDWKWQALRFSMVAALTVYPLGPSAAGWGYIAACAVAGLSYPLLFWLNERWPLPRWWLFDGPEAYARLPLGAAVIGGLSFL